MKRKLKMRLLIIDVEIRRSSIYWNAGQERKGIKIQYKAERMIREATDNELKKMIDYAMEHKLHCSNALIVKWNEREGGAE